MRLLLRLISLFAMLFFVIILLIRTQSETYDDLELLLLPPAGCEMPCFLGIQPGITRAGEAIDILSHHPWVGEVSNIGAGDRQVSSVRFQWSTDAPPFLFGFRDNALELAYGTEVVMGITVSLQAPTGEVWRVLDTQTTDDGHLLAEFINVDGANCLYDIKAFYAAAPERIYYELTPNEPDVPYRPVRQRSAALRCD